MATRRATGRLPREMITSSPRSALLMSCERFVFASWIAVILAAMTNFILAKAMLTGKGYRASQGVASGIVNLKMEPWPF